MVCFDFAFDNIVRRGGTLVEAKRGPAPGSQGSRPDGWDGPLSASRVCVLLSASRGERPGRADKFET